MSEHHPLCPALNVPPPGIADAGWKCTCANLPIHGLQAANQVTERLDKRYGRGNGALGHHGDCWIYGAKICTCGLLADLIFHGDEVQALYPTFWDEYGEHSARLGELNRTVRVGKPHPDDLIELIAVTVPVAELTQLRRAQAACEACIGVDLGKYESLDLKIKTFEAWLTHHTKGTIYGL